MSALDALFRDEVERQGFALRQGLERCQVHPPDGELVFAAQSIKSAASVVDMRAAERLADGLELLLGSAESGSTLLSTMQLQACADALELIEAVAQSGAALADEVAPTPQIEELLGRLAAPVVQSRGTTRSAPVLSTLPAATRELFSQECETNAATLSEGLLQLEQEPDQPHLLHQLMRAAHSMKGAARAIGLDSTVAMAHASEDQIERALRSQTLLGPDLIDALLASTDLLRRIGTAVVSGKNMPDDPVIMGCAERISRAGLESVFATGVEGPMTDSTRFTESAQTDPARLPGTETAAHGASPGADSRVLRIRAGQLSRLVALSAELVVESQQAHELAASLQRMRTMQAAIADLLDDLQQMIAAQPLAHAMRSRIQDARVQMNDLRVTGGEWSQRFEQHAWRNEELSTRLHREALDSRMRPVSDGFASLPRLVHDVARRLGKQAVLNITGETNRIDRDILERIDAPLNHLVRNALDHGLEKPAARREAGKPERGVLAIEVRSSSGYLDIAVSDDGAGIDLDKVRTRVVELGLAAPDVVNHLPEDRLLDYLFVSGFSTAEQVTEISGRGVGLAVVRSVMRDIGGSVSIDTSRHRGARFQLRVPISRAVLRAIVVSIAGEPHAFSLTRVDRLERIEANDVQFAEGHRYIVLDGRTISLVSTCEVLGLGPSPAPSPSLDVVVVSDFGQSIGFVVDSVIGEQEMVLLPLDPRLGRVPNLGAAAILPDGRPVMVIDAEDLVRSVLQGHDGQGGSGTAASGSASTFSSRRILVVDDSATIREMERELLERHGYDVASAANGMEAWTCLRQAEFGLVVTDVDMPLLDGIGLIHSIRQDARLQHLPVIVVSYRASAEERQRGLEAGANLYLTKSDYSEATLLESIAALLGES